MKSEFKMTYISSSVFTPMEYGLNLYKKKTMHGMTQYQSRVESLIYLIGTRSLLCLMLA